MNIFQFLFLISIIPVSHGFLWLPFANLGSMFETLKQTAFTGNLDFAEPDSSYSILELGKEFFNSIGNFVTSSFGDEEKMSLASNLREIFNLTTATPPKASRRIMPKLIPVDKPSTVPTTTTTRRPPSVTFTLPYTTPRFFFTTTTTPPLPEITTTYDPKPNFRFTTTTEPMIVKFIKTPKPLMPTQPTPSENEIIRFTTDKLRYATFAPNIFPSTTQPEVSTTTTPVKTTTSTTTTTTSTTTLKPTTTTTTTTTTPRPTTTPKPTTTTTAFDLAKLFTKPIYAIWPTTTHPITTTTSEPVMIDQKKLVGDEVTTPSSIIRANIWRKITPGIIPEYTTSILDTLPMTTTETPATTASFFFQRTEAPSLPISSTAGIPYIVKAKKFTRPPIVEKIAVTAPSFVNKYDTCVTGEKCSIRLKSFETSDPLFQYCYSHSTMIDDSIQELLRDTQTAVLPIHISWHQSVTPEVVQLLQTLMTIYRPSRCLVIGVFTGLGLLGVAERVDSRGIVVALEHPAYAVFWEKVGQKHSKKLTTAQMSRIQIRTSESIEKSLPRLATNEPNTFDFVFLDDFKRENYLDDYEHAIRLLRSGGLLIINQALNNGGVMSHIDHMTNDDRVIRNMNIRIKQDSRVSASLLPYGGGTWIISKN